MFCSMYVVQRLKALASLWKQVLSALTVAPGRVNTPMFPEIDTSFLGDAGPLPVSVGPHWSQHLGKMILVSEVYRSKNMVKRHTGLVVLVNVDARKGTLLLQRIIRRDDSAAYTFFERVGPAYHIAIQDCQFITVVSDYM